MVLAIRKKNWKKKGSLMEGTRRDPGTAASGGEQALATREGTAGRACLLGKNVIGQTPQQHNA